MDPLTTLQDPEKTSESVSFEKQKHSSNGSHTENFEDGTDKTNKNGKHKVVQLEPTGLSKLSEVSKYHYRDVTDSLISIPAGVNGVSNREGLLGGLIKTTTKPNNEIHLHIHVTRPCCCLQSESSEASLASKQQPERKVPIFTVDKANDHNISISMQKTQKIPLLRGAQMGATEETLEVVPIVEVQACTKTQTTSLKPKIRRHDGNFKKGQQNTAKEIRSSELLSSMGPPMRVTTAFSVSTKPEHPNRPTSESQAKTPIPFAMARRRRRAIRVVSQNYLEIFTIKTDSLTQTKHYKCKIPQCGFEATTRATIERKLNVHFQYHKNPVPFTCDVCFLVFEETFSMTRHKKKQHSQVFDEEKEDKVKKSVKYPTKKRFKPLDTKLKGDTTSESESESEY